MKVIDISPMASYKRSINELGAALKELDAIVEKINKIK